jgi:short-subunit dehydrogenase
MGTLPLEDLDHRRGMNSDDGRKFAVITGASSGTGFEFARVCAAEDLEVLLVAEQAVEEAAEQLRAEGAAVTTGEAKSIAARRSDQAKRS